MKKKLFENIGDNMFKLRKNLNESVLKTTMTIADPKTGDDLDVDLTVTYTAYPASRGERERGTGLQLEPDEEAMIDIESVKDSTGQDVVLSDSELKQLEKEISDAMSDADEYEASRYADDKRDQRDNDPYDDRYDESKKKTDEYRITPPEKKLIAKNLEVFPELKGLKKLESFKSTLGLISKALDAAGFELDMVTGDILLGQKGTRLLTFSKKGGESVGNSRINFTWENLSGDQFNPRYEVIAYVS